MQRRSIQRCAALLRADRCGSFWPVEQVGPLRCHAAAPFVRKQCMNNSPAFSRTPSNSPSDPAAWWRRTCWVADTRIALSGDLPAGPAAPAHLAGWVADGVTQIIDVRSEWDDQSLVAALQPQLNYCWAGADDDGGAQPDEWFNSGVDAALAALADPEAGLMVHCHMGVNRGPSMGFAIMLATGWMPVDALKAIVAARPIAAVLYAENALSWWHRRNNVPEALAMSQRNAVRAWLAHKQVDVSWVISRIRLAEAA